MDPQLDQIIESLLFASPEPLESKQIARLIRSVAKRQAAEAAEAAAAEAEGAEYEDGEELLEEASAAAEPEEASADEPETPDEEHDEEGAEDGPDDSECETDKTINLAKLSSADVTRAIEKLNQYYENTGRAFAVVERPNGWKLYSRPEFSPWLRELFPVKRSARLSPPALETLAIIAYRQPLTRAAIEAVRGVAVDGVVNTLVERGLIHIAGRADLPGRPLLYETTPLFFEHFNIRNIEDLPNAAELRQVKLPEPESEPVEEGGEGEPEQQEELDLAEDGDEGADTEEAAPPQDEQLEIPAAETVAAGEEE